MSKIIILITGTPGVGKTTISKQLAKELEALYINLTELAQTNNLISGEDKERKTVIINEKKMRQKISQILSTADKSAIIIDGHYAAAVVPKRYVTKAFVNEISVPIMRNTDEIHGGMGTNKEVIVEKFIRDAFTIQHGLCNRMVAYIKGAPILA